MSTEIDAQNPAEADAEATTAAPAAKKEPKAPTACECGAFRVLTNLREDEADGDLVYDEELTTGCGGATTRSTFAPGHDARLKSFLIKMGAEGHDVERVGESLNTSNPAAEWAKHYGFESQVLAGIAKLKEKAEARLNRQADRAAAQEVKEAEAAKAKAAKAVAKEAADKLKAEAKAAKEAAKAVKAQSVTPTGQVILALQTTPSGAFEPVGATFGDDRETYESLAKVYLGDHTDLSTAAIDGADWDEVFQAFVTGNPDEAQGELTPATDFDSQLVEAEEPETVEVF